MIRSAKDLEKHPLQARDGEVGKIKGLYLDQQDWGIRYFVVETGSFFNKRQVLISPLAVLGTDWSSEGLNVDLTREQVKNSPEVDTQKPVLRRQEIALSDYYGWPHYWGGPSQAAGGVLPVSPVPIAGELRPRPTIELDRSVLRTTHEATGYTIEATDGSIGHAEDFLFDDHSWQVCYLVIDTRNWWPGKKVLVSPLWISEILWDDGRVVVDLSRDAIKASPEYKQDAPLDPDYLDRLHGHYGKKPAATWRESAHL